MFRGDDPVGLEEGRLQENRLFPGPPQHRGAEESAARLHAFESVHVGEDVGGLALERL
jgi:hypothetical protein